jgi:diadenosine tetraphosphate (Ap4A) HIT family hydrolase
MTHSECAMCRRVQKYLKEGSPWLIHEFPNSVLMVGEHQMYPGYSVLVLKDHVRELHDLRSETSAAYYAELMKAGEAVLRAYSPKKMNYANYGNMMPHLHWHLFPRRETDSNWPQPVWTKMSEFDQYRTTEAQGLEVADRIRRELKRS